MRSQRVLFLLTVWAGAITLLGCGPITGTTLDISHPEVFLHCPSANIVDPRAHAFDAMVASLANNNWVVEDSNKEIPTLTARACIRSNVGDPLKQPISECLVLKFVFQPDGTIWAYNPPDKRLWAAREGAAQRWIEYLDRVYATLRCYSKEELARRSAAEGQKEAQ